MSKILKAAVIGLGGMGRGHLNNYIRLTEEGDIIKLVAACDINEEKFGNAKSNFNIEGIDRGGYDFSKFNCYTDMDEMLEKEELDLVTVALPTFLHCEATIKCLDHGINVLCEKPMALCAEDCQKMIDAAKRNNKRLMIGQCLRFWGEYEVLKEYVEKETIGRCTGGIFFRGGGTPSNSYMDWYTKRELGGGGLRDQHVHDVDMVQYLFGTPKALQSIGQTIIEGSGYDNVSTNYIYDDLKAINAQNDWTLSGPGFEMSFRVNFTGGTIFMDSQGFRIAKKDGTVFTPEYCKENAYYKEVRYFADCIINDKPNLINPPEASMETIKMVDAETASADQGGAVIRL